ncbi:hexose transporter hxt5 [Aspergillus fumigatus]
MIVGGVSLGTTFGGLYVIEHYGRRKLLIIRGVWMFAMALATASNWLWNFLIDFFTPVITGDIHFAYGCVSAGSLFAGVVIVCFCVLEDRGQTLEEMDMMYVRSACPGMGEAENGYLQPQSTGLLRRKLWTGGQ